MTTKDFGMGFCGRGHFNKEINKFREQWEKMSDEEKIEFMNKKMEKFGSYEDRFTVEAIDARCEEWMKKTPEEKEAFIKERKEAFEQRAACFGGFHGHHGFRGDFSGR